MAATTTRSAAASGNSSLPAVTPIQPRTAHARQMATHVPIRRTRSPDTSSGVTANAAYHPATHHAGGPTIQKYPPGRAAAQFTITPIHRSDPSQAQPQADASVRESGAATRQRPPQPIAMATSGAITGLSTNATGLTR